MSDLIKEAKDWSSYIRTTPSHIWYDEDDLLDMVDGLIEQLEAKDKELEATERNTWYNELWDMSYNAALDEAVKMWNTNQSYPQMIKAIKELKK